MKHDDLIEPGEEGAPVGNRHELANLTRRYVDAEQRVAELGRLLAAETQAHLYAGAALATHMLKERELLNLADELDPGDAFAGCGCLWCQLGRSLSERIRSILRLPE